LSAKPSVGLEFSQKPVSPKKLKLKKYQYAAVKFGVSRPAAGFFLAPGLGKTLITLMVFKILKKAGYVDELIVVAKRRIVYNVWRQEIKKWKFPYRTVILHGKDKQKNLMVDADVRLINYDGLIWFQKQNAFFRRPVKLMLAVDESSKLKHTTTKRFRAMRKILKFFKRRYILTGSPAASGLINLFGQIFVLDLGEALGTYITQFKNMFMYPSGYMGYDWKLLPGAKKRIYKAIKPLVIRFGTNELNMPPLTFVDKFIQLPPRIRAQYDEMEQERILRYKAGDIVAANAAVATGKLRQIANGGVYYSDTGVILDELPKKKPPKKWRTVHDEKCEELVELLEELQGEPALITFEFQHDKLRLRNYFAKYAPQFRDAPFIDGKSKDRDVTRILKKWDKGAVPVLFGHPTSVAHGLNLQGKGGIVIFFSVPWSLEDYEQFIQRVWRQGQTRRVIVYRILAQDTVDLDVVEAIKINDHDQTTLLEALNRRVAHKRAA
jgi:SNF2 family DNA or RNA helicase